ncbi:hypothetical protein [Bradyrhizobium uaiense]|uniref:Uncharacterized protein n=1 Tax=Bradyrhizobium uaiense TaxID=2594946 RepID=A0A6P1BSZ4_9BRAD|nr:hypothetical protein [Bradyrhizobium uaiense]NEV01280.1 hypothetical protein [Bradyrhizobium uaiense]
MLPLGKPAGAAARPAVAPVLAMYFALLCSLRRFLFGVQRVVALTEVHRALDAAQHAVRVRAIDDVGIC